MKYKYLIVLVFPLVAFTCITKKMQKDFVLIKNNLSQNIYCVPSFQYPDTSLNFTNEKRIISNASLFLFKSYESKHLSRLTICKKERWNELLKSDTLQFFVFNEKVVKEKNWDEIVSNKMYIKRLTFSYEDIIKNECSIEIR